MVLSGTGSNRVSSSAAADYCTRIINSFETGVNETTPYGNWTSFAYGVDGGNSRILWSSTKQYHALHSAQVNMTGEGNHVSWGLVKACLNFTSNSSLGYFPFDEIGAYYQCTGTWFYMVNFSFTQYNGSLATDTLTLTFDARTNGWTPITVIPVWNYNTTHFVFRFEWFAPIGPYWDPVYGDFYLDCFFLRSKAIDVRIRYWNLYTGLGYYEEKLLAKYYSFPAGWTDVWRGEFQAYKGDEVLLEVTDIFGRNVWTGIVSVDSDPKYVDILVPIVTVIILKPDWYNESVPMEWRITCLPWGPDGAKGMELPATGFEFEILAGWYSISWLENHYVEAGNRTVYIDGNVSQRRSFMLTDLSIPINPEYEVEVDGKGKFFDLSKWDDFWAFMGALYDDNRIKALSLFLLVFSAMVLMYRAHQLGRQLARSRTEGRR